MTSLQRYGVHIFREAEGDDPGANVCTLCEPRPDEGSNGPQLVRHVPLAPWSPNRDEAYAAGDFIVLACNSFGPMKSALEYVLSYLTNVNSVDGHAMVRMIFDALRASGTSSDDLDAAAVSLLRGAARRMK